MQIQIEKEKKRAEQEALQIEFQSVKFREAGHDEDLEEIDKHFNDLERI